MTEHETEDHHEQHEQHESENESENENDFPGRRNGMTTCAVLGLATYLSFR